MPLKPVEFLRGEKKEKKRQLIGKFQAELLKSRLHFSQRLVQTEIELTAKTLNELQSYPLLATQTNFIK